MAEEIKAGGESSWWQGDCKPNRTRSVTKIGLLTRSPSVNMNEDEEADANDLASEVETDRTRQKMRRDLAKFRRRLQEKVQLLLS